jgi:hypothetical protein
MRAAYSSLQSIQSIYASDCRGPIYLAWPHDTDPCCGNRRLLLVPATKGRHNGAALHAGERVIVYACTYMEELQCFVVRFRECV